MDKCINENCSNTVFGKAKYCSSKCRMRSSRDKVKTVITKQCNICGTMFTQDHLRQTSCSDKCREGAQKLKARKSNDKTYELFQKVINNYINEKNKEDYLVMLYEEAKSNNRLRQVLTASYTYRPSFQERNKMTFINMLPARTNKTSGSKIGIAVYKDFVDNELIAKVIAFQGEMPSLYDSVFIGFFVDNTANKKVKELEDIIEANDERTQLLLDYRVFETEVEKAKSIIEVIESGADPMTAIRNFPKKQYGQTAAQYLKKNK